MAKAKFTTGAQVSVESCPAAKLQRLLDQVVTKAGAWKSRIEEVQCTAIDARLTSMDEGTNQNQEDGYRTWQNITDELSSVVYDIESLLAESRTASKTERPRLQ